jgi:hypothetical protein
LVGIRSYSFPGDSARVVVVGLAVVDERDEVVVDFSVVDGPAVEVETGLCELVAVVEDACSSPWEQPLAANAKPKTRRAQASRAAPVDITPVLRSRFMCTSNPRLFSQETSVTCRRTNPEKKGDPTSTCRPYRMSD